MTTFLAHASELDLRLEPHFDATVERAELPSSVANPRRTVWTGFAKSETDRLPAG